MPYPCFILLHLDLGGKRLSKHARGLTQSYGSEQAKRIIPIELTVPRVGGWKEASERKAIKYQHMVQQRVAGLAIS